MALSNPIKVLESLVEHFGKSWRNDGRPLNRKENDLFNQIKDLLSKNANRGRRGRKSGLQPTEGCSDIEIEFPDVVFAEDEVFEDPKILSSPIVRRPEKSADSHSEEELEPPSSQNNEKPGPSNRDSVQKGPEGVTRKLFKEVKFSESPQTKPKDDSKFSVSTGVQTDPIHILCHVDRVSRKNQHLLINSRKPDESPQNIAPLDSEKVHQSKQNDSKSPPKISASTSTANQAADLPEDGSTSTFCASNQESTSRIDKVADSVHQEKPISERSNDTILEASSSKLRDEHATAESIQRGKDSQSSLNEQRAPADLTPHLPPLNDTTNRLTNDASPRLEERRPSIEPGLTTPSHRAEDDLQEEIPDIDNCDISSIVSDDGTVFSSPGSDLSAFESDKDESFKKKLKNSAERRKLLEMRRLERLARNSLCRVDLVQPSLDDISRFEQSTDIDLALIFKKLYQDLDERLGKLNGDIKKKDDPKRITRTSDGLDLIDNLIGKDQAENDDDDDDDIHVRLKKRKRPGVFLSDDDDSDRSTDDLNDHSGSDINPIRFGRDRNRHAIFSTSEDDDDENSDSRIERLTRAQLAGLSAKKKRKKLLEGINDPSSQEHKSRVHIEEDEDDDDEGDEEYSSEAENERRDRRREILRKGLAPPKEIRDSRLIKHKDRYYYDEFDDECDPRDSDIDFIADDDEPLTDNESSSASTADLTGGNRSKKPRGSTSGTSSDDDKSAYDGYLSIDSIEGSSQEDGGGDTVKKQKESRQVSGNNRSHLDKKDEEIERALIKKREQRGQQQSKNSDKRSGTEKVSKSHKHKHKKDKRHKKKKEAKEKDKSAFSSTSLSSTEPDDGDDSSSTLPTTKRRRSLSSLSSQDSDFVDKKKRERKKRDKHRKPVKEEPKEEDYSSGDSVVEIPNDPESTKETPGSASKRKGPRRILTERELDAATRDAQKREKERLERIRQRQELYNEIYYRQTASQDHGEQIQCLPLEIDTKTKSVLVEVDKGFLPTLKPHQRDGVKFLYEAVIESVSFVEEGKPGSGCILAHSMGLGKTLQVIVFLHTIMSHEKTKGCFKNSLILCPVNTIKNWVAEFNFWITSNTKIANKRISVYDLSLDNDDEARIWRLKRWKKTGGVAILGYPAFSNLVRGVRRGRQKTGSKLPPKISPIVEDLLCDPGPDIVIADEGHMIKNDATHIHDAVHRIRTARRIILTGTPLQNNLNEYYVMVNWVKPNLLGSKKEFLNRFVNPIDAGQHQDSTKEDVRLMKRRVYILLKTLAGVVNRQDYRVLIPYLNNKYEYVITVKLTSIQIQLYRAYLERYGPQIEAIEDRPKGVGSRAGSKLFKDWQTLKLIYNHPALLYDMKRRMQARREEREERNFVVNEDDAEVRTRDSEMDVDDPMEGTSNGLNVRGPKKSNLTEDPDIDDTAWFESVVVPEDRTNIELSGKMTILFDILAECEKVGDKLLVFTQSLDTIDMIEDMLKKIAETKTAEREERIRSEAEKIQSQGSNGVEEQMDIETNDDDLLLNTWELGKDYFRLDGSTSAEHRERMIKRFNHDGNKRLRLFLLSTKAGSLGINLVGANRCVIFDASWNPTHDIQAIYRIYRFGQDKPVYVYRLLAQATMEERIYERQVQKQSLSHRVVDEKQIARHFKKGDLQELYQFDPDRVNSDETPALPKDKLLASTIHRRKDLVQKVHEHDSLLENRPEEDLTEEEKQQAWKMWEEGQRDEEEELKRKKLEETQRRLAAELARQNQEREFERLRIQAEKLQSAAGVNLDQNQQQSTYGQQNGEQPASANHQQQQQQMPGPSNFTYGSYIHPNLQTWANNFATNLNASYPSASAAGPPPAHQPTQGQPNPFQNQQHQQQSHPHPQAPSGPQPAHQGPRPFREFLRQQQQQQQQQPRVKSTPNSPNYAASQIIDRMPPYEKWDLPSLLQGIKSIYPTQAPWQAAQLALQTLAEGTKRIKNDMKSLDANLQVGPQERELMARQLRLKLNTVESVLAITKKAYEAMPAHNRPAPSSSIDIDQPD